MRLRTRVSFLNLVGNALAVAAVVAVATLTGGGHARAADDSPASVQAVPLKVTKGDSLSKAEEEKVRGILKDYLEALKAGDYARAGTHIDSVSFLASVDTLARTIASSDELMPAARRKIFGASTTDSLVHRPFPETFRSYMQYQESAHPEMRGILARAQLQVLAARRMKDRVHVAYQLTLPAEKEDAQPYTTVTAEQMRLVGSDWKIVFRIEG